MTQAINLKNRSVAVLFAREDSVYKSIPAADVYDKSRDATGFAGGKPVVAHPPCRAWGRLRRFARPEPGEINLAPWAVKQVRENGGVLEHPAGSMLWGYCGLPKPGVMDEFGGWTFPVFQHWFGHRAEKSTLFYIVGCSPRMLPKIPMTLSEPTHVIQSRKKTGARPHVTKPEREHTPLSLAIWLIGVASLCK